MLRAFRLTLLFIAALGSHALCQEAQVVSVNPNKGGLNDTIDVQVENLDVLLKGTPGTQPNILPFLDGYELKGSQLDYIDKKNGELRFTLERGSDVHSQDAWNHVLSGVHGAIRPYHLSVGIDGGAPIASKDPLNPPMFNLVVFRPLRTTIATLGMALLLITFVVLAARTDLLKDPPHGDNSRTFSLGRCQMAWWTFIIMGSFLFIWLVTGDLTFPQSSLVLLGISSATALGAVIVDPNPSKKSLLNVKAAKTGAFFFRSLLDDGDGTSFHRFQIFAWTVILGIIFITKVVESLAQPTFDDTVLTLMGISSGTYIGFKFTEKPSKAG